MQDHAGQPATAAPASQRPIPGIADRARLEAERRTVGHRKPDDAPTPAGQAGPGVA